MDEEGISTVKLSFLGSGPEGADDLCFHTYGEFSPSPSSDWIWAFGLRFGLWGWDLGLGAEI